MKGYTVIHLYREVARLLSNEFPDQEIHAIQKLLFEKKLGLPLYRVYLNPTHQISQENVGLILNIVSQLKIQKPIQYILGETDFFGLNFKVTPDVLIPRPETEELVDWIIKSTSDKPLSILDIGTGSGCIAISLAANLRKSHVSAIDISPDALEVSKSNALQNKVQVDFYLVDILDNSVEIPSSPFDIIVSNPPYVRESEKLLMKPNVLDNEPHAALFVSDVEPLTFYNAIALRSKTLLKPGGIVYCEINEALGEETQKLFAQNGFKNIEIKKDLNGKDRMIKAVYGDGR